jgi:hypothetical protein
MPEPKKARIVRVRLVTVYEVDVDGWAREYGVDATIPAVRADARSYFDQTEALPDHLRQIVKEIREA